MAKITIEFDESGKPTSVASTAEAEVNDAAVSSAGDGGAAPEFDALGSASPRFNTAELLGFDVSDLIQQRGDAINAGEPPQWLFTALEGRALDLDIFVDRQIVDAVPAPGVDTSVIDGGPAPEE